ncbi:MAG: hypothetical protein ACK6DB_07020, partial [Planctomycetota bacterium]
LDTASLLYGHTGVVVDDVRPVLFDQGSVAEPSIELAFLLVASSQPSLAKLAYLPIKIRVPAFGAAEDAQNIKAFL